MPVTKAIEITVGLTNYWHRPYESGIKYNLVDTDLTAETYLRCNEANAVMVTGKLEDQSGDWGFYQNGTNMLFLIYHSAGSQTFAMGAVDTVDWHHYAAVYDNTDNKMYLYVDGVLQNAGGTAVGGTFPATSTSRFWIGRVGTVAGNFDLDEMRLSDNKRYTANFTPATTEFSDDANTILLFHFNEGSGNDTVDSASNPITMTAVGSPPDAWIDGVVNPAVTEVSNRLLLGAGP